jgi:DNA-binding GntR family transcriptional regulator
MPELFKQAFPAGESLVLRDSIYTILRRMIRYGELRGKFSYSEVADKVADKLSDEEELSNHRSHASDREAILEALAILVRDGFVQHRPEVGFEVRVATFDEVLEIFALRAKIEGRAVEKLSNKPDDYDLENDDDFDQVIKAQNNMREESDSPEFYPFKDWDTFFHIYMVIAAGFGSDRAWRTIGVWRDKLQLCRVTASEEAAILSPSEKEDILDEHEAILDACPLSPPRPGVRRCKGGVGRALVHEHKAGRRYGLAPRRGRLDSFLGPNQPTARRRC